MTSKKLTFQRMLDAPFIKPNNGTVAPDAVTTPDIVTSENGLDLFLGAVEAKHERIIHMKISYSDLHLNSSISIPSTAVLVVEPGPSDFDRYHVFDPAVIMWKEKTHLYYSAVGEGQDSIGLAISNDNENFTKCENPVLIGRSPEVIAKNGTIYLFYVQKGGYGRYSIYLATSSNGLSFTQIGKQPILSPGDSGGWDDEEVTTPRIIKIDNMYYMIYAGLKKHDEKDVPKAFGLARSKDLINWEKYPNNPVFQIAKQSSWDDGAIWFGSPFCVEDNLYLIYEGGQLKNILGKVPALTQVGLAKIGTNEFMEYMQEWK